MTRAKQHVSFQEYWSPQGLFYCEPGKCVRSTVFRKRIQILQKDVGDSYAMAEWHNQSGWLEGPKGWSSIKVLECVVRNVLVDEAAFASWVPSTLHNFKSKFWQKSHKLGIRLPEPIHKVCQTDGKSKWLWWEATLKKWPMNDLLLKNGMDWNASYQLDVKRCVVT